MDYRGLFRGKARQALRPRGGSGVDISQQLLATTRPAVQLFWTVVVGATLIYTLSSGGPGHPRVVAVMLASYAAVVTGNRFFPYSRYRPLAFFLLMCSCLVLISCIVFLSGNRASLLAFLFFFVPVFAASYFSYPGTLLVSLLTALARCVPFVSGQSSGIVQFSLALSAFAYILVGVLACFVFEGETMYARESHEYRHLLELALDKERDISLIYNLSRKFSYTLDLDTVLKTTAAMARKMLSSEGALVFLVEDGKPSLMSALGILPFSDMSAVRMPAGESWVSQLEAGNNVVAEKASLGWLPLPPGSDRLHSLSAVPLFTGADIAGYLICFSPAARAFKETDLDILSTLASQAVVAVEKARLYTRTLDEKTKVETILSALRDGLLVTDSRGVLVQTNPVADRLLGIGSSAAGCRLLDVLTGVLAECDLGPFTPGEAVLAVLGGRTIFGEMEFSSESRVCVQAHFIPLEDQLGKVCGMVLFLHDITDLKRIDELKTNFVSNVSHELRTPLTSIAGFVKLLLAGRAGALSAQQRKYLDIVSSQASDLTEMIESILDLSRLQSGSANQEMSEIDLRELVNSVTRDLSPAASEKDIEIRSRLSDTLPHAEANPARISQVLTNIIDNAVKFTGPGGLVEISALHNGPLLQVQVSDSGVGIPSGALPHIFDRFFQARSGEVNDTGGFGLGLAISREIVEMSGGKIWAESDPGRGSTFYFTLPVHR